MRKHYDFRAGDRGRYSSRLAKMRVAVVLEPDVAEAFPDAAGVNEALRELISACDSTTKEGRTDRAEPS